MHTSKENNINLTKDLYLVNSPTSIRIISHLSLREYFTSSCPALLVPLEYYYFHRLNLPPSIESSGLLREINHRFHHYSEIRSPRCRLASRYQSILPLDLFFPNILPMVGIACRLIDFDRSQCPSVISSRVTSIRLSRYQLRI